MVPKHCKECHPCRKEGDIVMKKLLLCPHWNHTMSATFIELDTAEIDDFPSLGTMQHVHTPAGWPRLPAILICTYVLPCARGACNTRPRSGVSAFACLLDLCKTSERAGVRIQGPRVLILRQVKYHKLNTKCTTKAATPNK